MGIESEMMLLGHRQLLAGDFGGTITWSGTPYPAVIGSFDVQQILNPDGGGFTPIVLGLATIAREDLPTSFAGFKRGQMATATPNDTTRPARSCRIYDMRDCGALIEITLNDANESA